VAAIAKEQAILRLLERLESSDRLILDFKEEIKVFKEEIRDLKARLAKYSLSRFFREEPEEQQ